MATTLSGAVTDLTTLKVIKKNVKIKKNGFETDDQIHTQLIRYICIPTQALAYKMGEKCLIECLQKFHKDGGKDIKKFHSMILEDGAIPLYILREKFGLK